ncbi:MAG: molybdopterin-dependent oxidoreductase [Armatimonadetes bacterium]|nr:molybdopterin-dependent oxidoreductase [Armatimonadota bacterium]
MIDRPTICGFCSCGCALYVEPKYGGIGALCPSTTHPVSTGRLCIKGWNAIPSLIRADRLRTPLVRKSGSLEPTSWEEAFSTTAEALRRAISESGPKAVGVIGSAKITNEECYSLVKFARGVLGTPNIDGPCRFYDASMVRGLLETTGIPASQIDLNSLQQAGSMLIVGANVMEQLAHVGSRIQDAVESGCKVVAADPRVSRLAPQATLFLHPHPGTDIVWIRALLRTILDRKLYAEGAPEMPGFEELRTSLEDVVMDLLPKTAGVEPSAVIEAASLLAKNPPVIVMFGLGVLQQAGSTKIVRALADVAILLGGSVMPLRGQNNAQGASDMGLAHDYLPGYGSIFDAAARQKWESVWRCEIGADPGLNAVEMIKGCANGEIKALMVFGENVALSAPSTEYTIAALEKVGFLAVSDLYLTETARLANVVFPACSFLEKDGTFTNIERRVQRVRKVLDPLGNSKSDLEIIAGLSTLDLTGSSAKRKVELSNDPDQVMAEVAANVPHYEKVSYQALDQAWGDPWSTNGAKPRLAPVSDRAAHEDTEYPMRLIASRINFHMQTGTMAARSPTLAREYPEAVVELNEADAERLKLRPGTVVKVSSRFGNLTRPVALSDAVPEGCVHVPHFFGGDSANMLAPFDCDAESGVPVYKGLHCVIQKASD